MGSYELLRFPSDDALAHEAADRWISLVEQAVRQSERHLVALSGGRIAKKFFQASVLVARRRTVDLAPVHFYWADERCVPPDHPESNFGVANRLLLEPLGIATSHIHRLNGEADASSSVSAANTDLRGIASVSESGVPVLDLILLGMGEDGHVASLFPQTAEAEAAAADTYLAVVAPKPPPRRVTLGYRVLAAAKAVWVLISGAGKEMALRESLLAGGQTPLGRVLELRSSTLMFSDIAGI